MLEVTKLLVASPTHRQVPCQVVVSQVPNSTQGGWRTLFSRVAPFQKIPLCGGKRFELFLVTGGGISFGGGLVGRGGYGGDMGVGGRWLGMTSPSPHCKPLSVVSVRESALA